jgi:hypothetical protein
VNKGRSVNRDDEIAAIVNYVTARGSAKNFRPD